jgi:outer membrane receptor for ferrienterochelin and colicin
VTVERRPQWLESTGFYDRVAQNLGQHVTPEDLERRSTLRFSEVLRDVPGIDLRPVCTPHCYHQIRMAGTTQSGCIPTFYMDGRRVNVRPKPRGSRREPPGLFDLDVIATGSDIAAVEVYRSIAETPPEFYGRCGSIVIWTKRGAG